MEKKHFNKNIRTSLINIIKLRLFNFKLFGNLRFGLSKEVSLGEIEEFIKDFNEFLKPKEQKTNEEKIKETLPDNQNFIILKRLCEQYYIYEGTEKFSKKIIEEVTEIIEELRNDKKTQQAIEVWLNKTQNDVITKLRKDYPELKEEEIKLFCYIKSNFTPTMISVLLKKDKSIVYNRVSRLKAKIYK
ncbi:MAG: hypothetical protein J6R43_05105 [Paludibacteraceae bacterium]|nr:hypothetical protein [Paludibacteraceae bacterium]